MALTYLQIFADKEALLEPFDDAERGRLLSAMLAYALRDELLPLTGNERYIWPVFREMIDKSRESLEKKQAAGRSRQEAQGSSVKQAVSTSQQTEAPAQHQPAQEQQEEAQGPIKQESRIMNHESIDKNQEPGEREKRARFSPPTAEEVAAYAQQAGLHLEAQRFVDFYASKGWRVGQSPMKDWHAAARNWAARDKAGGGGASPPAQPAHRVLRDQDYTQREYQETPGMTDRMAQYLREIKATPDAKEALS